MTYHIQFQAKAIKEYGEAAKWYKERSEQAAENFVSAIVDKLNVLRTEPDRFRKVYKEYREVGLKKYPYTVIYAIREKEQVVAIASIFHQKRHPKTKYRNLQ